MKIYFTQNETDNDMLNLMKKDGKDNFFLYAVVHSDFLCDKDFGGGYFNKDSVLNRFNDDEEIEMDLILTVE